MGLFYDEEWDLKSDEISYGHDIEAAWLLYEAALAVGEKKTIDRMRTIAVNMTEAVLPALNTEGGLFHDGNRANNNISDQLEWWAQAEAIVGFLNSYEITGEEAWLDRALSIKNYIEKYFIDGINGEWFYRVDKSGNPINSYEKAGPWKCPYHTARMCLEIIRRLE